VLAFKELRVVYGLTELGPYETTTQSQSSIEAMLRGRPRPYRRPEIMAEGPETEGGATEPSAAGWTEESVA